MAALAGAPLATGCNRVEVAARPTPSGPNVLLITIDTLRADYVGVTAQHATETPALDALAAQGTLFENASATVPLTLPSHSSILTGQYPPHHGVRHNSIHQLAAERETVAERFQAAGYATHAIVASSVLGREFGLAQGFDAYSDEMPRSLSHRGGFPERTAQQVSDLALAWLASNDRPFLLWLHYYDPHSKYRPPEPFRQKFAHDLYAGEVAYVDHELGRVIEALKTSGRLENTIIVATADHGEGRGEHGEGTHSYLIYESTMHVPLILRGPGVPRGKRIPDVVSNAAIAPTLLALTGLPALSDADVPELGPQLRGEGRADGWAYSETLAGHFDHGWAPIFGMRTSAQKFIRAPRPELFDLASDPGELDNLLARDAAPHLDAVASAQQRIDGVAARETQSARVAIDDATRRQIEALGYVVPSGNRVPTANAADPKDVERYAQLAFRAKVMLGLEKYAEAERWALEAIEKIPTTVSAREDLARVYFATNRKREALEIAEQASRLAPESPKTSALVGELRIANGDRAGGFAMMEHVLALDPNELSAHLALMAKLRDGATAAEIEPHAQRVLELGAEQPDLVEACGEAWESAGEYERAAAAYQVGVERAPHSAARLHMRLAILAARFGDDAKLAEQIALAGAAANDSKLAVRLAVVFAARGDVARAEPMLRALVMRDASHTAPRLLARLLREHGRAAEAARIAPQS